MKLIAICGGTNSGKTTISDKVPEGTSYVPDTIVGGGNYDEATKTITWNNIEVKY